MRKLTVFGFAFAAGVFASAYLLPGEFLLPAGVVCALLALPSLLLRGERRTAAFLVAAGLSVGLLWCYDYGTLVRAPALDLAGEKLTVEAVADGYPQETDYGGSLTVRVALPQGGETRAVLYLDEGAASIMPGDKITFTASFLADDTMAGEDSDYYFSRGVYLRAYADGAPEVERPEFFPVRYWPTALAQKLRKVLAAIYPPEVAGLMAALTTGERSGLPDDFYAALQRCGMAHVVAVSGMHLVFLSGLVQTLSRGGNRRRRALITIPVLLLFMALTGFPASVVRAGVMQILLLLAPIFGRERDTPTAMALAALVLLAANPDSAADVGLQLSFCSVAGIQLFSRPLAERMEKALGLEGRKKTAADLRSRLRMLWVGLIRFAVGSVATTLGALAFTTPLTASYFGTLSLVAPLANLLGLWAVSWSFALGLLSAVLGLIWLPLGKLLALGGSWPAEYLLPLAPALGNLPVASRTLANSYLWLWVFFVYAVVAFVLLGRKDGVRPIIPVSACTLTLVAALILGMMTHTGSDLTVSVLDVGQGLCVVLHSEGKTVMVDCGGSSGMEAADAAAAYVQSLGTGRVDLLVLTHCHDDHANGVSELLERLEVSALALPDEEEDIPLREEILALAEEKGSEVLLFSEDGSVSFGAASLRIYAPLGKGETNEAGLSVLATCGSFDVLITGDMGETVEKRLVRYGDLPDIELLVVGHHGSKYSTGEELLEATRPEYAAISVGYNTYGHPAEETLERLAAAGCAVYRTDQMGTVSVRVTMGG